MVEKRQLRSRKTASASAERSSIEDKTAKSSAESDSDSRLTQKNRNRNERNKKSGRNKESAVKSKSPEEVVSDEDIVELEDCKSKKRLKGTPSTEQCQYNAVSTNNNVSDTRDTFLTQLSQTGFKKSIVKPDCRASRPVAESSRNMLHVLQQISSGIRSTVQLHKAAGSPVIELIKDLELYRTASPFDRRVTALEWHPTRPSILAVGSKGGDIILWNTDEVNKEKFIQGIGAAGSCQAMKFWPWDTDKVVSASINGTVTLHDFEFKQGTVLADTGNSYDHWYCSLDVNPSRYMVVAGRNNGILHMMSTEGRKMFEFRLHKNKITHVEFSPREDWLLCTASTDQTVQFWDVRYMKDRKSALQVLNHDKPVNSAYFSHTDGCRVLTTDQGKDIRVYRAPFWHLETTIEHPHRFFQHITPFKASWHPLQDLIVCGRYPDKTFPGSGNELRTIDIFDAATGEIVSQMYSHGTDGLCPLNKFNWQGDALASGMGFHILMWNRKQVIARKQSMLIEVLAASLETSISQNLATGQSGTRPRSQPRQPKRKKPDEDIDELKKKSKTKSSVKPKAKTSKSKNKLLHDEDD